jgi:hypothetical protein
MSSLLETALNEAPVPSAKLGAGFWAAWAAGMAAAFAAFAATLWLAYPHLDTFAGKMVGGAIVIAFTLAFIFIANIPNAIRRKRGFGERMREPNRRYMWRFLPAMFAYVILLMAAISYAKAAEPTGVIAWLVAIAPAVPILFAIRAIFLLPVEEDDEYQRARIYSSYAWATGATLMVCTAAGFLDMFGVVPHLEMWIAFPMWAVFMGLARCLPLGSVK